MRHWFLLLFIAAGLSGVSFVAGCDREVSHSEKTTTHSDGSQTKEQHTTVEHPDGSTSTTTEKKSTNGQ